MKPKDRKVVTELFDELVPSMTKRTAALLDPYRHTEEGRATIESAMAVATICAMLRASWSVFGVPKKMVETIMDSVLTLVELTKADSAKVGKLVGKLSELVEEAEQQISSEMKLRDGEGADKVAEAINKARASHE